MVYILIVGAHLKRQKRHSAATIYISNSSLHRINVNAPLLSYLCDHFHAQTPLVESWVGGEFRLCRNPGFSV